MNRRGPTRPPVLSAAGLAVVAAGCDGGSQPASTAASTAAPTPTPATTAAAAATMAAPAAPPDSRQLVSLAVAGPIVSVPLQPGTKAGSPPDVLCQCTSSPTGPTAQVEIFVGDGAKKSLDIDRDELQLHVHDAGGHR